MSQLRNLRYIFLPSKPEAEILQKAVKFPNSITLIHTDSSIDRLATNLVANTVQRNKQLELHLNPENASSVYLTMQKLGLGDLIITKQEFDNKHSLLQKINRLLAADNQSVDTSGSWHRMYGQLDQLAYGDFVMSSSVMGEKSLHSVIAEFIENTSKTSKSNLNHQLRADHFKFDAQEYWHIKGRVHQAALYYNERFDLDLKMHDLHPVFFEMYSIDEAEQVIQDTTTRLERMSQDLLSELYVWYDNYSDFTLDTQSKKALSCRNQIEGILSEITDIEHSFKTDKPPKGWFSFGSDSSETYRTQQVEIVEAYHNLLERIERHGLSELFELPSTEDVTLIRDNLSSLLKNYHNVRRHLKKQIDRHLSRLNGHNIESDSHQQKYQRFQKKLQDFLTEINGLQLLKQHVEDNTLDVSSQMQWLKTLCSDLTLLKNEVKDFRSYMEWRQFESLLKPEDKEVIQELKQYDITKWVPIFDHWYLKHYIDSQDLIPIQFEQQFLKTINDFGVIAKSELKNLINLSHQEIAGSLKRAIKSNKRIKVWLDGNIEISQQAENEYRAIIENCFPVVLVQESHRSNSCIKITNIDNIEKVEVNESPSATDINMNVSVHLPEPPPSITRDILHSIHSDRIQEVRSLAKYILSNFPQFEIWQNQKWVYFSFMQRPMNQLILPLLPQNLYTTHVSKEMGEDELIETLLNNHNRIFASLFSQDLNWSSDHWSGQWHNLRSISLLKKAGMEFHYISWSSIFNSAEIVSFLKLETAKKQSALRGI
jgi:hypothetical protein